MSSTSGASDTGGSQNVGGGGGGSGSGSGGKRHNKRKDRKSMKHKVDLPVGYASNVREAKWAGIYR